MSDVQVGEMESLESALKRFNKRVQADGILADARRHEYYEKPSEIKRRAAIPAPGSPIQFAEFIKKEIDTWGEVVRATGTKPGT